MKIIMTVVSLSSLTRISDLDHIPYEVTPIPKEKWDTGDYVIGEITGTAGRAYRIELATGRMISAMPGDHVVGAFGNRSATLEGVGSWSDIKDDRMNAMTSAGLFGAITSLSAMIPRTVELKYLGHAIRKGKKVCMSDLEIGHFLKA